MNDTDTGIEKEAIPFQISENKQTPKTLEIKYTISGSTFKTQLPVFNGGTAEEFLHFLNEFQQARTKLGYTNYQKLESGLEQLLQGTARNEWTTIKATVDPNVNTLASFASRIDAFRRLYIPEPAAIETQKNYLRRVRKNDRYTVPQFLDRMKHVNMLIPLFPDATTQDSFSQEELKSLFYHAMPVRWRTNFINSGLNYALSSIDTLRTYMVQQELQTEAHRKKNREGNKRNSNNPNFTSYLFSNLTFK